MRALVAAVMILGLAGPVGAQRRAEPPRHDAKGHHDQHAKGPCPVPAGWAKPERHSAARAPRFQFGLKPNTSHQLQLHPRRAVDLGTRDGRRGRQDGYAGLAALDVARAGKLQVALSTRAYVDVIENGRTLKSVAHGRAECGGVFKTVTFDVRPGRHVVQITDAQARAIKFGTIQR